MLQEFGFALGVCPDAHWSLGMPAGAEDPIDAKGVRISIGFHPQLRASRFIRKSRSARRPLIFLTGEVSANGRVSRGSQSKSMGGGGKRLELLLMALSAPLHFRRFSRRHDDARSWLPRFRPPDDTNGKQASDDADDQQSHQTGISGFRIKTIEEHFDLQWINDHSENW